MRQYRMTIRGKSPLLMHWDNIDGADEMMRWRKDPKNKKISVPGDDRSPAWTWVNSVYNDGKVVALPADNIMRAMMEGGAMVVVKGNKTFKAQTQSGMVVHEESWPVVVDKKPIDYVKLVKLKNEPDFQEHQKVAAAAGFYLYVKRASVGTSKHIRVRPRFDRWEATGTVDVWDEQITEVVLLQIAQLAGEYRGIGDWRPGGSTPGPYGRFEAELKKI